MIIMALCDSCKNKVDNSITNENICDRCGDVYTPEKITKKKRS
jgi:uncharacterized protein YnzC (UPF0291/DUF896 family)